MGFARKQMTKEVSASPRLLSGSSAYSIENPVPWDVPAPVPVHPHLLTPEMFLADVKAAGKYMYRQMLLLDYREHRLFPILIIGAEELIEGHTDLLVAFNTFLPKRCQCTVPK